MPHRAPSSATRRVTAVRLAVFLVAVAAATALAALHPGVDALRGADPAADAGADHWEQATAEIVAATHRPCDPDVPSSMLCASATVRLDDGTVDRVHAEDPAQTLRPGRTLHVTVDTHDGSVVAAHDVARGTPLAALLVVFAGAVVALSRWQGARSLLALALTLAVAVGAVVPSIAAGADPVLVAVAAGALIAVATMYLAHGRGVKTDAAVLSAVLALSLTSALAWATIHVAALTGLTDPNVVGLARAGAGVSLPGLLLAGIVLGALGVLDDVTVSQSSTVASLRRVRPDAPSRDLLAEALRVGRDHVAAAVNTLVLAYVGAALPLLLVVDLADPTLFTSEVVAVEVARAVVGSLGLIAAVPLSTALAAALLPPTDSERSPDHDDTHRRGGADGVRHDGGAAEHPHGHGVVDRAHGPDQDATGDDDVGDPTH